MPHLSDILLTEPIRGAVIDDCVQVIEAHIAGRRGIKGIGLKAGLAVMKTAKPDILIRAVGRLLPDLATALEPCFADCRSSADFPGAVLARREEVIGELVSAADRRIAQSVNPSAKSLYARLRGSAESEVDALLPALAQAIARHLP